MEHRYGGRYAVDIAVYASTHGGVVSSVGQLLNISLSGGWLYTVVAARPLSLISLRLIDADGNFGPRLEGRVIRQTPQGLGIEWIEDAAELIRHWADPASIEPMTCSAQSDRKSRRPP